MEEILNTIEEVPYKKVYKENPSIDKILSLLKVSENIKTINHTQEVEGKIKRFVLKTNARKEIRSFVKFYDDSNALDDFIKFSSPAQKLVVYAIRNCQKDTTYFYFRNDEFCSTYHVSNTNVSRAISELLKAGWLFKSPQPKKYWINMSFFFKGSVESIYYKSETGKREFL